ncbi:MAG: hypothetical protein ACRC2T_01715 [Thermoguttaceae bacterium]
MSKLNTISLSLIFICLQVVVGCGGKPRPDGMPALVPCVITVIQDGANLGDATISLQPVDSTSKWAATGSTSESGADAKMYTWGTQDGVVPGKYKVVVDKTKLEKLPPRPSGSSEPSRVPQTYRYVEEQYTSIDTTPIEIDVVKGTKKYTVDVGKAVEEVVVDARL